MPGEVHNKENTLKRKRRFRKRKLFLYLIALLVFVFVVIPAILHIRPVQNFLVDSYTASLSKKIKTRVDVGSVDFSMFKGLILENVRIMERGKSDLEMIKVGRMSSTLKENLLSLFRKELSMRTLSISGLDIRVRTEMEDSMSNVAFFLNNLLPQNTGDKPRSKNDLAIKLGNIELSEIYLHIQDLNRGVRQDFSIADANMDIREMDLANNRFHIGKLLMSCPSASVVRESRGVQRNKPAQIKSDSSATRNTLQVLVDQLEVSQGQFTVRDQTKPAKAYKFQAIDYNNFEISDFYMNAANTALMFPLDVATTVNNMRFREAGGFEINRFNVGTMNINTKNISLDSFYLQTGKSVISEYMAMEFEHFDDFKKFEDNIFLTTDFTNSELAFSDLIYFFPELNKAPFFRNNSSKKIRLSGNINGTINDLEAENIYLAIGRDIELSGDIYSTDITDVDEAVIFLNVDQLKTDMRNLRNLIPGFRPPLQFNKLGKLRFKGDLEGFIKDFVIFGDLETELGYVSLDSRLDIKTGVENASYSGYFGLNNFDLRRWTGNQDFGYATFTASVEDGQGLILKNAYARLAAKLEAFEFKNYNYQNIVLNGELRQNLFDGVFTVDDPNVKMDFSGFLQIDSLAYSSDFEATIGNIDLYALNLSPDTVILDGQFDLSLKGKGIQDFTGSADIKNFRVNFNGKNFNFDSLLVSSSPGAHLSRSILVSSNLFNFSLEGYFDFTRLGNDLSDILWKHHKGWAAQLNLPKKKDYTSGDQNFRFKIDIPNTRDYLELANLKGMNFKNIVGSGQIDLKNDVVNAEISVESFSRQNIEAKGIKIDLANNGPLSKYLLGLNELRINDRLVNPIVVRTEINEDIAQIEFTSSNILDSIGRLDIKTFVVPYQGRYKINFLNDAFEMFGADWNINTENEVIIGPKYVSIENFDITDGRRSIFIDDIETRGFDVRLNNFDFALVNGIIDYDKIDFTGKGNLNAQIRDVFTTPKIKGDGWIPEFQLNKVNYGDLTFSVEPLTKDMSRIRLDLLRDYDGQKIDVDVTVNTVSKSVEGKVMVENVAMNTFEFIIDDGISNTHGHANLSATVSGTLENLKLDGKAQILDGGTTIDYLANHIEFGEQEFTVTERRIDLTNVELYDRLGNTAVMSGGLNHNLFSDFNTRLTMQSLNFLGLDTRKQDNPVYYGQGIGNITVYFDGPFSSTDIVVNAVSGKGTVFNIPIEDTYENFDESFIKFVDREEIMGISKEKETGTAKKLEGVDVQMNLTLTEDAEVNIIFNEKLNDIISGRGNGDLRIVFTRDGKFDIFGDYTVESGNYLFTAWGIVAKPFTVRRGGRIVWTGDPVNANLNIEAEYEGVKTPLNVFLSEYLLTASDETLREARQRKDVDLLLKLGGTLYNPLVSFDLNFPDLQGELRSYADSKLRLLRQNESDLNDQVAGLIIFGSFLPSNNPLAGNLVSTGSLAQSGYNTLSEFVSNQLSYLLSGFLQEAFTENGFVSGIDFEIGFTKSADLTNGQVALDGLVPDEIEVHFKPRFQNDRWGFDYGTNFVRESPFGISNYVIHDFVIEYYLTVDRRLKLRAYGKWDKDEVDFENEQKYGIGINYKKEFGDILDFKKALKEDVKTLISGQKSDE